MVRKLMINTFLICGLLILSVFLLFSGKGHTLLLDNKSGETTVTVIVDSLKPVTISMGERELVVVKGINHTISVTTDGNTITRKFSLPMNTLFLCSIPALVNGSPVWFEVKQNEKSIPKPDSTEDVPIQREIVPL